jgi:transforming growth factor-beta-induced protein
VFLISFNKNSMNLKQLLSTLTLGGMSLSAVAASAMTTDTSMMMNSSMSMKTGVMVGGAMMVPNLNIVQNALNAKNVTTVVAAVKAAGLADTLSGPGPFTVFAPTNYAFTRLPAGTVATLLKPENKDKLMKILTYHVVAGRYTSADLKDGMTLKTVEGDTLSVKKVGRNIWINGVRLSVRDVISSNGVTHIINNVLMPPANSMMQQSSMSAGVMVGGAMMVPNLDIVANAVKANNVTTLVAAVQAAGLVDTLKGTGPFTVFAPTNDAFAKLPTGTVDTLLKPENKDQLVKILTYHVVPGRYTSADLKDGMTLKTVEGDTLKITVTNGKIWINGSAMVETADVISSNGVTHVINGVLLPQ